MSVAELVEAAWPVWFILWIGWGTQAVLAALLVRKFLRRRILTGSPRVFDPYRPRAFVIVPFKGADDDLPAAIASLMTQEHENAYRLICVVESEADPAYPILQRELTRHGGDVADIVIAGQAPPDRGQKVHNLLAAIDHVEPLSRDEDAWVFADSDAVPGRHWLGKMVGPLVRQETGVATGYRWLIPAEGAGIWSDLASIINSSVASFLGRENMNHAWGGSMAMRVATARQGELRKWLQGAVSDDYQVTRMCRSLGLQIRFVPECLVASPVEMTFPQLLNFAHRQHLITRIHAPWLYVGGIAVTGYYTLSFLIAWAMFGHWLYHDPAGGEWLWPLAAMAVVFGANLARSHYRRQIVRSAFGVRTLRQMRRTLRIDRYLTALWMAAHLLLLLRAAVGRTISWRGIRYRIDAPQKVQRLP